MIFANNLTNMNESFVHLLCRQMNDLKSIPVEFASDSLLKSEAHISGDRLTISATHRREPSDQADISFHKEDCYYFVFLYDGGNLTKNNEIMEPHKYYITKGCIHVKGIFTTLLIILIQLEMLWGLVLLTDGFMSLYFVITFLLFEF